jgi:hypothetical protein
MDNEHHFYGGLDYINYGLEIFPSSVPFQLLKAKCYALMEFIKPADAIMEAIPDENCYAIEKAEILYLCGWLDKSLCLLDDQIGDADKKLAEKIKNQIVDLKILFKHIKECKIQDKCCLEVLNHFNYDFIPLCIHRSLLTKRANINIKVSKHTKLFLLVENRILFSARTFLCGHR